MQPRTGRYGGIRSRAATAWRRTAVVRSVASRVAAVSNVYPHAERQNCQVRRKHMGKLDGKIALVTGGNSGIGLATTKEFVNEGAYVFITGRREAELARAVKEMGKNAIGIQGDVSKVGVV